METDEPAETENETAQSSDAGASVSEVSQRAAAGAIEPSSSQHEDVENRDDALPPMDVAEVEQPEQPDEEGAVGGELAENAENGENNEANIREVVLRLGNEVHALINVMQEVGNLGELYDDDIGEFYGFPENDAHAANQPINNDEANVNVNANENANVNVNVNENEIENAEIDDEVASNSTTNSNMSLADTDSDGVEQRPAGRWLIPQHHVNEAIGQLISQARRSEGGIAALLDRDNFMQRVRSMIFSLERNRQRRSLQSGNEGGQEDGNGGGGVGDAEPLGDILGDEPVDEVMQSQSVNDNLVENESTVRFDTNLPGEHSYFGPNLNRVPGVNYLDVDGSYRMLIFMHQHLLFPGEVLPFMINGSIIEEEEENGAWSGREGIIFGIVFPFLQDLGGNPLKLYGVTCQIYERGESGREMVFFKSRALQRFVADCNDLQGPPQYIATNPKVKCYGVAKILPEVYLPEPLNCVNMGNMNRFRDELSMRDKFRRFQSASTPWPAHVYNEFSISDIVEQAREKLEKHKIDTMPTCPTQLSFWLVRNLHLTEKLMHAVFMTDSVNVRLKMIGRTFKGDALFFCRYCNNSIAECHELFAMSKHGVQTQYCNSAGYIHETNTVYRMLPDSVSYSGESSTEFSWFPGYKWRIIVCKFCTQHIGWEFKAIEPNLVPKVFFGLAGSSVRISKASSATSNNMRPFVYRNLLRLVSRQME